MSSSSFGPAWAPSTTRRAPASWAIRAISSIGLIVPSTFETCVTHTSFGPSSSSFARASRSSRPSAVIGAQSRCASLLLGHLVPGDDVRVVLHLGDHDAVAGGEVGAAPRVGDQVERLGRVADEDDLAAVGAEMGRDRRASTLVERGRLLGEGVDAAVDVGVVLAPVAVERLDHRERLLGGRAVVEIGERFPVDLSREDRELRADLFDGPRQGGGGCRRRLHRRAYAAAPASTSSLIQP